MSREVRMEQVPGFTYVDGGVTAAKGFVAAGMHCGLHPDPEKNDLALIFSENKFCQTAAVFTTNKVKGAPILVCKSHLTKTLGASRAVIANCKNANTCNADGVEKAEEMCTLAGEALGIRPEYVLVASTGVIGQPLPMEPIRAHVGELAEKLSVEGHLDAAKAIMTTDTVKKEVAVEFVIDGVTCRLGGMAKGSGMINPNMATTLNFITTDCCIDSELLQTALSDVVKVTYNCLSVDGDMSTNDTVLLMANSESGMEQIKSIDSEAYKTFRQALYLVMMQMTRMLAKDGEGATKLLEVSVTGAPDQDTALAVSSSVVNSSLLKCAIFGEDANWGRILCAIGYTDREFEIDRTWVALCSEYGEEEVCRNGAGVPFSEEKAAKILSSDEIVIKIDLGYGTGEGKAWGCDLTYDYVKINGDYRS